MTIKEYLKETYGLTSGGLIQKQRLQVICEDGFFFQVRAGWTAYCTPRKNLPTGEYEKVEIVYPQKRDELIDHYGKWPVYEQVPVETVDALIEKHGGINRLA